MKVNTKIVALLATLTVLQTVASAAVDFYIRFKTYDNKYLTPESSTKLPTGAQVKSNMQLDSDGWVKVADFSFDIEQTLNIGSQSSGAGAGKITFNPFSITLPWTNLDPTLYEMGASGTAFSHVDLVAVKSSGGANAGSILRVFDFKLVAVKTISWAHDDESPKETVTFEYGGLLLQHYTQLATGAITAQPLTGWNRVRNIKDVDPTTDIK